MSKKQPAFQAIAVSDGDENEQQREDRRGFWTPTATKPPLLITILCFVLALIALLQIPSSLSSPAHQAVAKSKRTLQRRQIVYSTEINTGFQQTITGTTITWQASIATFPSVTITRPLTQTITGTTESVAGYTSYIYETVKTVSGTPVTQLYELKTSGGSVVTDYVSFVTAVTSAAYLDTSNPNNKITVSTPSSTSSTPTSSLVSLPALSTIPPSASQTSSLPLSSATSPNAYLLTSSPTATPTHLPSLAFPPSERIVHGHYTTARYYAATYLPSILIILLKVLWSHVFASTKLIEPFHQLSTSHNGATSTTSLLADYLSPSISLSSLSSFLTLKRPVMFIATITTTLITILAPIGAESMGTQGTAKCPAGNGLLRSCAPVWSLNMTCVRVLQALLAIIFALIMIYIVLSLRRHNAGVRSDPSSINTVARLLGNQEFAKELCALPPNLPKKDIKKRLAGNRYNLSFYPDPTSKIPSAESYGITKTNNYLSSSSHPSFSSPPSVIPATSSTRIFRELVPTMALLTLTLTLFALILAYSLDYKPDTFNNFFSSNTFGPRFILSSLATMLSQIFHRLEREVRICTPWQKLSSSYSNSKYRDKEKITHRGLPLTPYTSLPSSVYNFQLFLALLSFVAILGDVLIIAVVGVPYSDVELYSTYKWSVWLSISILALMLVVSTGAGVWMWRWRRKDDWKEIPDTVLGVARRCLDLGLDREADRRIGRAQGEERERAPLMVEHGQTM